MGASVSGGRGEVDYVAHILVASELVERLLVGGEGRCTWGKRYAVKCDGVRAYMREGVIGTYL